MSTPLLAAVISRTQGADGGQGETDRELAEGWEFYQGPLDPRFQVWHSEELVTWEKVTVPHCFNYRDACDPEQPAYRGPGWYRLRLPIRNPYREGRTLLHFEGAGQRSKVYVGTTLAGEHEGGYDEFVVDITDACRALRSGEPAQVAILCDNSRDIDALPSDLSDFTLYGGLYRPVHLVYVPAVSIAAVHTEVRFEPGQAAQVRVAARLYAPGKPQGRVAATVTLTDPQGAPAGSGRYESEAWDGFVELKTFALEKPALWSPDHPNLYRCEVRLEGAAGANTVAHRFGVRHTRFIEHGPFHLNGERLLLRGTHRHEDHAGFAAAMPAELIRREMTMIKEMGANFIRLAHYQQRRLVLELCDELGILVWEEVPWCRSGVGSAHFQEQGKRQLENMIEQHRHHPSVLLWGLGNEDDWPSELNGNDHAATRRYMTELRDLAHQLDPTRLTSYRRGEFARDIPDVYSPSIWAGWYSGRYTEYKATLEQARNTVPRLLHVEWGADSHAGRHAEDADPTLTAIQTGRGTADHGFDYKLTGGAVRMAKDSAWTETYACDLFEWYLQTMEQLPWLTGAAQWAFKDFTTPLRVDNPIPRVNQKGVVERDLTPKEGYFVFQSYWATKPMVHVYGHRWPVRWGRAGQKRTVRVYSNCAAVELLLNGKSLGTRQRDPRLFPAAGLTWEVAFAPGRNELRAVAVHAAGQLSDAVSFEYETRSWGAPARLAIGVLSRTKDRVTVQARLLDAHGVPCLDAREVLHFSLSGAGALEDNLGTARGSRIVQAYNGRAEISARLEGAVTVGVTSGALEPAFVEVHAG